VLVAICAASQPIFLLRRCSYRPTGLYTAEMFGCFYGLKDTVTAITFVALGTSLPDTFASSHAAKDDKTADAGSFVNGFLLERAHH
jgi:hypothetical protein